MTIVTKKRSLDKARIINQMKNREKEQVGRMSTESNKNKDTFLMMKDKTNLFYRQDFPEKMKAVLVIVHGVCEHCGRYQYLAERLGEAGYGVIRFDLRGHGKSEGKRGFASTYLEFSQDAREFVLKAKQEAPGMPVYMLGHSMGSFISAAYGILYPDEIKGQVLSGLPATELPLPTIRLLKHLPYNLLPMIQAGNDLGKIVSRDPAVVKAYIEDPLNLKKATIKMSGEMFIKGPVWMAEHIKEYKYPCLLLHGGADMIVAPSSSEWFFNSISSSDKQRKVYPELYHEIYNEKERDEVIADTISWLDAQTGK